MAYQLHSRSGEALSPPLTGVASIVAFRTELERQRDFHRGTWFWSRLLILVPSYLLFVAGLAVAQAAAIYTEILDSNPDFPEVYDKASYVLYRSFDDEQALMRPRRLWLCIPMTPRRT
jgi:hypothetical protein